MWNQRLSRSSNIRSHSFYHRHHTTKTRPKQFPALPPPSSSSLLSVKPVTTTTTNTTHVIGPRHKIPFSTSPYHHYCKHINNQSSPTKSTFTSASPSSPPSTTNMSSDDAYTAFLDKANEDPSKGITSSKKQEHIQTTTVSSSQRIPTVLSDVDMYYISDTDEAFEGVALDWSGAAEGRWPTPDQFKSLILPNLSTEAARDVQITILTPASFDPKNQYADVLHAVRTAVAGGNPRDAEAAEVKVYQVQMDETRAEYWVLALERGNGKGRIVGLKAKAVES
ncbi:hypothetical protein PAAG_00090 [Paracoccidioides lutzii Pb01]|uniref:Uncharacterized protein n=1 Tax=Paracoccidioides lutzii (strain ATCC MYA-826 / Pb01) TaxID=502779 RepID=C1GNJ5_PARBA|nr:hypothetical protein PAAG_00090 [Paracoccidioides lutzii Pb01]EEH35767.1 hypothetical protein PAAG_00090 [Paracoccidioides lutzii Pb01]